MSFLRRSPDKTPEEDEEAEDLEAGEEGLPPEGEGDTEGSEAEEESDDGPEHEDEDRDDAPDEEGGADNEGEDEEEGEAPGRGRRERPLGAARPVLRRAAETTLRALRWKGWTPALVIVFFLLALALRSYFYWPEARADYLTGDNWLLSGNDPNYHKRAVDHLDSTHTWLAWDPLQNYPGGGPNPNPPGFETSMLLFGYLLTPFAPDGHTAVWWGTEFGGVIWSSLLVFPVFFVGREMFGRRAGLIAAFLIAVMAGNVERNVLGFSDHDGYLMFFIACGFFFYIRAMEHTKNRAYVTNYKDLGSVTRGFQAFFKDHRIAFLYTALASTMWGATALGWKGFPYVYAILLLYYFVSVIAMRWFRHEDPFALGVLTMFAFTFVIVLTLPYYYGMHFMHWYDIFYLLWAGAALITIFFVPTRNVPSVLLLLLLASIIGGAFIVLNIFAPEVAETIFSGAGYFSRNKLYTTIAEAQAPDVSRLVASYGYATSLLALGGIGVMAWRLPRRWSNAYVLMLAWAGAAIYMALTAVRFMYNATPLFAVLGGWMLWGIIDKTHFSLKSYRERWRKFVTWRKLRAVPVMHWAVALFLAFMVVTPNVMQGLDAGIPFESKKEWDTAIYNFMPDLTDPFSIGGWTPLNDIHFFRPSPALFTPETQGLWYLGAFGTSFMNDYWAVSMKWLASQDRQVPEEKRPGFISWWDYGHWAMDVGEHPTAADNFQNGFEFAGNFIGAQGEDDGNSLILARYLETVRDKAPIVELAKKYLGAEGYAEFERYAADPTAFSQQILDNPAKYMPRSPPLSERNAFYILVSALISERVTPEDRIWWIRDIKQQTGLELRYFAVDVRMMPFSASQTGIFYAPIILADYDKNDFVQITCTLSNGRTINCDDLTAREYSLLQSTQIQYQPHFYDSMFTRAYLGYTSNDLVGGAFNGFPGIRASCKQGQEQSCLAGQAPMQGFNMSHWRLVQRSVYFNPNATDLTNHSREWKIITDEEANAYEGNTNVTVDRQFLGLGENTGTGVFYLKYYAGAWVNGTVATPDGAPVANARVTVYDDVKLANPAWPGVPHGYSFTDDAGRFSALVPFGNVTLVASVGGGADPFQLREQVEVGRIQVPVSDNQAMRIEEDRDGDGVADYNIGRDIQALPGALTGRAYLDKEGLGAYSPSADEAMAGATLHVNSTTSNTTYTAYPAADGVYRVTGMAPGIYYVNATWKGHTWQALANVRVAGNQTTQNDLAARPGRVSGNATDELGRPRANATLELEDDSAGGLLTNLTPAGGTFEFPHLLPGNYTLRSTLPNATPFEQVFTLAPGEEKAFNFTAADTVGVTLRAYLDRDGSGTFAPGEEAFNASVEVQARNGSYFNLTKLGGAGTGQARYPPGPYALRAVYSDGAGALFGGSLAVEALEGGNWTLRLTRAAQVNGSVYRDADGNFEHSDNASLEPLFPSAEVVLRAASSGAVTRVLIRSDGTYDAVLPADTYSVQSVVSQTGLERAQVAYLEVVVSASTERLDIPLSNGTRALGSVGFDSDRSGTLAPSELIVRANLTFTREGFNVSQDATAAGDYTAWLDDGNWTLTVRAPGYITNSTSRYLNGSDPANNTLDMFLEPAPVKVQGRIGFDRDGDGNLSEAEGFAGVLLNFTAEAGAGPYFNGSNVTAATNATGDFTAFLAAGHYAFNLSVDRGAAPDTHRYEAWNASASSAAFHPLFVPTGDAVWLNLSLRELTGISGVVCFDENLNGACEQGGKERPAGATALLRGPGAPVTLISAADGAFQGFAPSGDYTVEVTADVLGSGIVKTFLSVDLTREANLGIVRLRPVTALTIHAFNDRNGNGLEDDGAEPITGPTVTVTDVTSASASFVLSNASFQLLPGRTYAYAVDQRRSENVDPAIPTAFANVLYRASGNFTFDAADPVFKLPLPRRLQVTGAFYYDRNGDGVYTPNNREEPQGAAIEFRDEAAPATVVERIAGPTTGAFEVFLPLGNFSVTVDHSGFDRTNSSWRFAVTEQPPTGGFKMDLKLTAHDVDLTGFTFRDLNRNGRMNAFESGVQAASLKLFNATNLSDVRDLAVGPDGRYNVTLKPGAYTLFAQGTSNGSAVAGFAQATVDPVGGFAWANVSLRPAFVVSGAAALNNTTGSVLPVPATAYTLDAGGARFELAQPQGAFSFTLPDGAFALNATVETREFGVSMNYTVAEAFTVDYRDQARDLNFTKVRRYTAEFNYFEDTSPLAQGANLTYNASLRNTGTDNATFDLAPAAGQVPSGWTYNMSVDNLTLEIGESKSFTILINTSNQTRAGVNVLQVKASARNATGDAGFVQFNVTTRQDWGFDVRQDVDAPADIGSQTNYFVAIENKGNGIDKVEVTVSGLPPGYSATLERGGPGNELELQPFRTERVLVALRRDAAAPPAQQGWPFLVEVRSVANANNTSNVGQATLKVAYADLRLGGEANATRVTEPGRGNLVEDRSLTTPGFEGAAALGALLLVLGVSKRHRRRRL
ncbi:MAG TPA: carboxypeptidase regulatory-like domain-containing protein [Candidatus Thermoplasmatota archaeon]|nr:carboxypeptidase regulatory-like domain-containing protein [Candidatus Thermoplasmatota archaeon]